MPDAYAHQAPMQTGAVQHMRSGDLRLACVARTAGRAWSRRGARFEALVLSMSARVLVCSWLLGMVTPVIGDRA